MRLLLYWATMGVKVVCSNKKAFHDYFIEEKIEAGLVLRGTEVKSLREGRANLKDAFARVEGGEAFLYGFHISPYSHGTAFNHEPERTRKLLLHKREILRLHGKMKEKGLAVVALRVYFKAGRAKVELGLARGKRKYDKRQAIKKREDRRDMDRAMKRKTR